MSVSDHRSTVKPQYEYAAGTWHCAIRPTRGGRQGANRADDTPAGFCQCRISIVAGVITRHAPHSAHQLCSCLQVSRALVAVTRLHWGLSDSARACWPCHRCSRVTTPKNRLDERQRTSFSVAVHPQPFSNSALQFASVVSLARTCIVSILSPTGCGSVPGLRLARPRPCDPLGRHHQVQGLQGARQPASRDHGRSRCDLSA